MADENREDFIVDSFTMVSDAIDEGTIEKLDDSDGQKED